jgi:hypothetical protein
MSYSGISVREVMAKINAQEGGWFLPQVQRQYVWGQRYESEEYVCSLLDSLLKRYPIGGVVLWETKKPVPFREFVRDYSPGVFARQVDSGRWSAFKSLVYDGQQRLQTLYSVLYHRFNSRVLHFDLLFDSSKSESDETGFTFRDGNATPEARYLRLTELVSTNCNIGEKIDIETKITDALKPDRDTEILIRKNIGSLWDIFVDTQIKSIAYFPVTADSPSVVNEVFRRLNTGGMALSQLDLVLSKIKAVHSDYEEELWKLSEKIHTCTGISFSSSDILQFFHLLVKGTVRIDEDRLATADIAGFVSALTNDADALLEFFEGYLYGLFKINHESIIPRWLTTLPIAAYLVTCKRCNFEWKIRKMSTADIARIHRYFILSQFCDWNTQTMVNSFATLATEAATLGKPFPINEIESVAVTKARSNVLHYHQFLSLPWLAHKILAPSRSYIFAMNKPQVDHIFPLNLPGQDDEYKQRVDVLWNYQPIHWSINNYKRAKHPKDYFTNNGSNYFKEYDFVPPLSSTIWDDPARFIRYRHKQMRRSLMNQYGLRLIRLRTP